MVLANCPGNLSSAFSSRGGYQVLILSPEGYDYVGGLDFAPAVYAQRRAKGARWNKLLGRMLIC